MQIAKTPTIAKKAFHRLTWNKSEDEKAIYLTFDDGPTPEITIWILKLLAKYDAKATFFCLGKNVVLYPKLLDYIICEGHTIGNHTYNHLNAWKTKKEKYLNDIDMCEKVFHSKFFRPPYGKLKPGIRTEILANHEIIMWDVMSYDFDQDLSGENCYQNVIKHAKEGSIIVFHDSLKAEKNMKASLPKVLAYFAEKGFVFKAL